MKLLFVLPEFFPLTGGGICTYYEELLPLLQRSDMYELTVIQGSAFDARGGETNRHGIPVHYLMYGALLEEKKKFSHLNIFPELQAHLAAAWAMYEKAKGLGKFDAVITSDWGLAFVPWILTGHTPTIVHLHGSLGQIDHYEPRKGLALLAQTYLHIEKDLLQKASSLVTHSRQNIRFWINQGLPQAKTSLIPPIVAKASKTGKKRENAQLTGLVIARVQFWKGPIYLCEAIRLMDSETRARLNIYWIGRDTFYTNENMSMGAFLLKNYPDVWGKTILPLGIKTREELDEYYNEIDFGIVPSIWDMFNLSALEHLAHAKPLICSSGAGASDFMADVAGITVYDNTASGLAQALTKFIASGKENLEAAGKQNSSFLQQQFNQQTTLDAHFKVIEEAVRGFVPTNSQPQDHQWLWPQTGAQTNARAVLLESWPNKETIHLILKKLKTSFKSKLNLEK